MCWLYSLWLEYGMKNNWLEQIKWDKDGLVPAIAQETGSGQILMLAWMNREALELTVQENRAIYWSRSRNKLWRKGEESGHIQALKSIRLDCDNDVILLEVEQLGGIACHTGRHHCFYKTLKNGQWIETENVLKSREHIYEKENHLIKKLRVFLRSSGLN